MAPDEYGVLLCRCGGNARLVVKCDRRCASPALEGSGAEDAAPGPQPNGAERPPASPPRSPSHSPAVTPMHHGRHYARKRCPCGASFTPTGPRATYCRPDCPARPNALDRQLRSGAA